MGLDQLLELTSSVASKALPICGVVVLIFLAVFVKHLIVLLKNANDAVVKMSKTLETTNRQLETLFNFENPKIKTTGKAAEYAE